MQKTEKVKQEKPKKTKKRFFIGLWLKSIVLIILIMYFLTRISLVMASFVHTRMAMFNDMDRDYLMARTYAVNLNQDLVSGIFKHGMEIYESIPEEERQNPTDPAYLGRFSPLQSEEYNDLKSRLTRLSNETGSKWIDLRLIDEENRRVIFLLDTEERDDDKYSCGYWIDMSELGNAYTFEDRDRNSLDEEQDLFRIATGIVNTLSMSNDNRFSVYAPFYRLGTKEIIGYIGIGEEMTSVERDKAVFVFSFGLVYFFILVLITLILIPLINRILIKPLTKLSKAAKQYGKSGGQDSRIFEKLKIRSHDEIYVLWESMRDMEHSISSYMENLTAVTAENQRIETELDLGAGIQRSMLPKELSDYTKERDFHLSASIRPAREVGGDFYDFFAIDEDHIGLCIADVSGKGVPASLFMVVARTLIKNTARQETEAAKILERVNREICENNPELMFVTVFFGIYTVSERILSYVNAGHEDPAVYRKEKGIFELLLEEHDPMIGYDPELTFTERKLSFSPGDRLFLYTDGIPESTDPSEALYGTERMMACLNEHHSLSGNDLLAAVEKDALAYAKGAPQFDDMTMLLLEVHQI